MKLSKLNAALDARRGQRLADAVETLQDAVCAGVIYNVDFEDAKRDVAYAVELAIDQIKSVARTLRVDHPTWDEKDPRWAVIYTPQLNNAPSAVRKLQPFKGQDAWVDFIVDALEEAAELAELVKEAKVVVVKGRKPASAEKQAEKERNLIQTGVCSCCGRRQKLDEHDNLVAHGYTLRWGFQSNSCFGTNRKAWEVSPEGAVALLVAMNEQVEHLTAKATDVTGVELAKIERTIRSINDSIPDYKKAVTGWKAQPLKYGRYGK